MSAPYIVVVKSPLPQSVLDLRGEVTVEVDGADLVFQNDSGQSVRLPNTCIELVVTNIGIVEATLNDHS